MNDQPAPGQLTPAMVGDAMQSMWAKQWLASERIGSAVYAPVVALTADDLAAAGAAWAAKYAAGAFGPPKLLTPLPRRARLRLWAEARITSAGIWLMDHGQTGLAIALWRACGMWR